MSRNLRTHIFLFVANLIYGASFTIAKALTPHYIEPYGFILIRVTFSLFLFSATQLIFIRSGIARKDLPLLIVCGLVGVAMNQLLFFKGLSLTRPINAALIMISTPILVVLFTSLMKNEKLTMRKGAGSLIAAIGAAIVVIHSTVSGGEASPLGDLLIFLNAACYAIYLVIVKPLMEKYHPIAVIAWVFLFGEIFVLPVGWNQFAAVEWTTFTFWIWAGTAFIVIFTTYLAYLLNIFALRDAPASTVGIYIYAQPLFATLIAVVSGKDFLNWETLLSSLLIFIGVYLVSFGARKFSLAETEQP